MQLVDLILGLIFCLYERGIKILHLHGFIQTVQVSVPPQWLHNSIVSEILKVGRSIRVILEPWKLHKNDHQHQLWLREGKAVGCVTQDLSLVPTCQDCGSFLSSRRLLLLACPSSHVNAGFKCRITVKFLPVVILSHSVKLAVFEVRGWKVCEFIVAKSWESLIIRGLTRSRVYIFLRAFII
jgi:hypothetical protein